jgi:hypothetical protein
MARVRGNRQKDRVHKKARRAGLALVKVHGRWWRGRRYRVVDVARGVILAGSEDSGLSLAQAEHFIDEY